MSSSVSAPWSLETLSVPRSSRAFTTPSSAQGPNSFWPSVGTSRPKKAIVRTGKRSLASGAIVMRVHVSTAPFERKQVLCR